MAIAEEAAETRPISHAEFAVSVRDLVKVFPHPERGELRAVDGVSFDVRRGEIFGLVGPNGAGKTTTLEIIEGIQPPSSGDVEILGMNVRSQMQSIKPRIGVQLQQTSYLGHLQLRELLSLYGSFYPKRLDPDQLLSLVGLSDKKSSVMSKLSGGQGRRMSIAMSLVNDPDVVFLDEPTSGLDPQARRRVWEVVDNIRRTGRTVVFSTHYMDEAEVLCDRVAIIDHGKIRALDTPLHLIQTLDSAYHIRFTSPHGTRRPALGTLDGISDISEASVPDGIRYDISVRHPQQILPPLLDFLKSQGVALVDLRVEPSTLEDVFLSLTGRELRD